jgi:hypothetical protein
MVVVTNGKITLSLENQSHIDAYLSSGWVEAKASAPAAQEEPKAEPDVDFMNPPEATETAEAEIAAPIPKRGRKKQER